MVIYGYKIDNKVAYSHINGRKVVNMGIICLIVFIGLCIKEACEPTLPADYHRNWRLEAQDADKVRYGEMSKREFLRNMDNGKYR